MNIERGNQFLVSSVLVSLYAITKVLGQIWGSSFCSSPPAGGYRGPFLRLWAAGRWSLWQQYIQIWKSASTQAQEVSHWWRC